LKIAILGGGIGGLSAAIALKQKGFDVEVYERHSQMSEIGAGIVCWPNASFVLQQLGVLKHVESVSGLLTKMKRFSSNGEVLGALDISALNQLMSYPSYSIYRKDLMAILTQRLLSLGIKIHYQHNVETLTKFGVKASVQFTHGKSISPDVIVGADGRMLSITRKYVNKNNAPVYQGFINWIGTYESSQNTFSELIVSDYWGVGQRFGIVPVSKTKAYWAGGVIAKHIEKTNPDTYKPDLKSLFNTWPDIINQIIDESPSSSINKIYVHDHDPINHWHKDNVILMGDAAHSPLPTSGQGACQALEDAWHFANCLAENNANLAEIFKQFTALRLSKTSGITMAGRQLASSIFNASAEYCQQRNIASQNTDYNAAVVGMAKSWSSGLPLSV